MGSKSKNKKNNTKPNQGNPNVTDKIITDSRFASIHSDPRFQRVPKHKSKVSIDSRFSLRLSNKSFAPSSAPVDKRGRPTKKTEVNPLSRYYGLQGEQGEERDGESESEEEERGGGDDDVVKRAVGAVDESEEEEEEEKEDGGSDGLEERDESESSTDSDDDEDIYEEEEKFVQESIPNIEKETHRLAVIDMDWRHVKAVDLYVLLSSFLPKDGQILSVAVYPSEFGLERMKEEEVHGPVGLFDDKKDGDKDDDDDGEIDNEELRAYEKSRLRYYFAVVECDSVATADYLYNACDGAEFERSANVLDLRFIPDSMEFKHPPRDVATEGPANYDGLEFQTRALQQSKIQLTWEEDEPERVKTLKRKFNEDQLAELELKEFLASDESESDDDDNFKNATEDLTDKKQRKREAYRALLEGGGDSDGGEEDEKKDMEVTFITGLEDLNKRILEKKDQKSETVWEAYLRKRREKKKAQKSKHEESSDDESGDDTDQERVEEPGDFFLEEEPSVKKSKKGTHGKTKKSEKDQQGKNGEEEASRAVLELLLADENGADNSLKGYNLKRKKAKGKDGQEALDGDKIPSIDYEDPRFSTIFTSPDFALDPTDPQFKRSAVYARQLAMKQQKGGGPDLLEKSKKLPTDGQPLNDNMERRNAELEKSDVLSSNKEKYELSSLVRSVKMKSKQVEVPSSSSDVKEKRRKRAQ